MKFVLEVSRALDGSVVFRQFVNSVSDHEAVQLEQVFCSLKWS